MNKNIVFVVGTLLILSFIVTGCTETTSPDNSAIIELSSNLPPVAHIQSSSKAYFGETIEFDASKSSDDGEITSYNWDFMDGITAEGKKVSHVFEFDGEYNVEYPIIYTIMLQVGDDKGAVSPAVHQIELYPKNFVFYLEKDKMTTQIPENNYESVISGSSLIYSFESPIVIPESTYNLTLNLEKKFFSRVNKIKIELIDQEDSVITENEVNMFFNNYWLEKNIEFRGDIYKEVALKTIKINVNCFSLLNPIKVLYGAEETSHIIFEFNF